jgi:hypothetical protein
MTCIKQTKAVAGLALGAMLALAALASPASARWNGNGQYQHDNRQWQNHTNGYNYQAPPVVYEGGAPSISIHLSAGSRTQGNGGHFQPAVLPLQ